MKNSEELSFCFGKVKEKFKFALKNEIFYLKAEINSVIFKRNICYLHFIEYKNDSFLASCSAIIFEDKISQIINELSSYTFYKILIKGNKITFKCNINFHELFGLQLYILNIDKESFLGELELQKRETLNFLLSNNISQKSNKILLPKIIRRIALITSENSAAHTDFMYQIANRKHIYVTIFDTLVQGEKAKYEIINNINKINISEYDVIVLIRGGGSSIDLHPFNDLELAKTIYNCKLPIMIGIGHAKDDVAINKVGYSCETPTSVVKKINYINFIAKKKRRNTIIIIILIVIIFYCWVFYKNKHVKHVDNEKNVNDLLNQKSEQKSEVIKKQTNKSKKKKKIKNNT